MYDDDDYLNYLHIRKKFVKKKNIKKKENQINHNHSSI